MENILENNKLIAEFMGLREQTDPTERWLGHWFSGSERFDRLHYNTSWDWLMPVVEKIESLHISNVVIVANKTIINFHNKFRNELETFIGQQQFANLPENRLDNCYQAITEFIKWYNQQNKQ